MASSTITRSVAFGEFKSATNSSNPHYYFAVNPGVYLAVIYPYNALNVVTGISAYLICVATQTDVNYYAIMENSIITITAITITGQELNITWGGGSTSRIFFCPLSNQ